MRESFKGIGIAGIPGQASAVGGYPQGADGVFVQVKDE